MKTPLLFFSLLLISCKFYAQVTFDYTGAVQTYTVPACVFTINVDVRGAEGGTMTTASLGGKGGRVEGNIAVTPGEVLYIYVGQKPGLDSAGWNGGGRPGASKTAGGGGGASDIRQGGSALSNRIVVGGGGGGASHTCVVGNDGGGIGGGLIAGDGWDCNIAGGAGAGKGGRQTAGGAAATGCGSQGSTAGSLGQGGIGGISPTGPIQGGGGGGGGYYGGGGGNCRGGGGGSSYTAASVTNVIHTAGFQTGNGQVILTPIVSTSGPAIPPVITGDFDVCAGQTLTYSITAVPTASTYTWTVPAGAVINSGQGSTTVSVTFGNVSGSLSVTAANSCGTSSARMQTVVVYPAPVADAGKDTSICLGQPAMLAVAPGFTTLWNTGETTSSIIVSPPATSSYEVSITDANGCVASDIVVVTVNPLPTVYAGTDDSICAGEMIRLNGSGTGSFRWTPAFDLDADSVASPEATPDFTTTFTLTVTNSDGCSSTDDVLIRVKPAPAVLIIGDTAVCVGGSTVLTASGGTTYLWSTGETTSSVTAAPSVTSIYSVEVTDSTGCSATAGMEVEVVDVVASITATDFSVCRGTTVTLYANGGSRYLWSTGSGKDSIVVTPSVTTLYHLVAYTGNCSDDVLETLTVYPLPQAKAGADVTVCISKSVQLSASGGSSYSWAPESGLSDPTVSNPVASPDTTTTYIVSVTDNNGCVSRDTLQVVVDDCTGIDEFTVLETYALPNPTDGLLFLSLPSSLGDLEQVQVTDFSGRVTFLHKNAINRDGEGMWLDLSGYAAGTYSVILECARGNASVRVIRK